MATTNLREELKRIGCTKFCIAESDHVIYIPAIFVKDNSSVIQELKLKEIKEDTFFRTGRHIQQGTEMIAFQY